MTIHGLTSRWLPHGSSIAFLLGFALFGAACPGDDAPPAETDASSTTSSGDTMDTACTPGESMACACPGGGAGVQTCNVQGNGYNACDCSNTTNATTTTDETTTTDGPPGDTDTTDTTDTTEGPSDTTDGTTTDGEESSSSTGEVIPGYGPCPSGDGDCTYPTEICGVGGNPLHSVCLDQGCVTAADCPPAPPDFTGTVICGDLTGDGAPDCYLGCAVTADCAMGMDCLGNFFCSWPP